MAYIISHRGNGYQKPENSKEALITAFYADNNDGIELDVRMTKDERLVIHHNLVVADVGLISNLTWKEIHEKTKLCLLEDVLKAVKGNKAILLDLKTEVYQEKYLLQLRKMIKKYPLNYYICSFHFETVKQFKQKYPTYQVGIIQTLFMNQLIDSSLFDFRSVSYLIYKDQEMVWTINKKDLFDQLRLKEVFIVTDHPEWNTKKESR